MAQGHRQVEDHEEQNDSTRGNLNSHPDPILTASSAENAGAPGILGSASGLPGTARTRDRR